MPVRKLSNRYYAYHVQVGNKGSRLFQNLKFLTEELRTKESSMQISQRANRFGWPVSAYSNAAKTTILVTKHLIESSKVKKQKDYLAFEDEFDSDYIGDGLDMTKKHL